MGLIKIFGLCNNNIKHKTTGLLLNFTIPIDKVQTREKAFVNAGGIDTKGIHPKTMESKEVPGLYFVSETVDVHGPIGGFNITIALSTGFKCGNNI